MFQVLFFDLHTFVLDGFDRLSEVHRVPKDKCCHHEVEFASPVALIFVLVISDLA